MTATIEDTKRGNRIFLTPKVPQGLAAAVEGLTREVIRHRPENIYVFAAHHFENLLRLREQYDNATINDKKNVEILHDMSEALKERPIYLDKKDTSNLAQQNGWSLNETAKVLEKHRSIFGENGHKISTEQVRELANEPLVVPTKLYQCGSKKRSEKFSTENKNNAGKSAASSSNKRKESPRVFSQDTCRTNKSDSKNTPKIISQIPLAKDIKTELRKNRISSRERKKIEEKRMQFSSEYSHEVTTEKIVKRSYEKSKSRIEYRSEHIRKSSRVEENTKKKSESTKNVTDSPKKPPFVKSQSMDRVKNYVMQNFIGMSSLDELQSPSYVEKVQEVIDETSSIIKEKVEALKAGVAKASTSKHSVKDRSSSSEGSSKASNKSSRCNKNQEVSSGEKLTKDTQHKKSSQSNVENSESSDDVSNFQNQSELRATENSEGSNESKTSLPAVRPLSSKSTTSRSLSARSDSDGLTLPPISPELIKSPKVKEESVTLPALSPPNSSTSSLEAEENLDLDNMINEQKADVSNEEFHDSLNVTPELVDSPQRPDSLETSGHNSPIETLKDKLIEIEDVQKRIESALDDSVIKESSDIIQNKENSEVASKIEDKLLEIQESEKRIEKILDIQSANFGESEELKSDIKIKLQELEDVEKRIENILINESEKESFCEAGTNSEVKVSKTNLSFNTVEMSNRDNAEDSYNDTEKNSITLDIENIEEKNMLVPTESNLILSPHSYILTEGSPYDIPDTVTRVIIPDRIPTPDSDTLRVEVEDGEVRTTFLSSKEIENTLIEENTQEIEEKQKNNIHDDAFGETVSTDNLETSTVDTEFIRGIKASHEKMISRQDLDFIKEEHDKESEETEIVDSEDEKVLKVVTSSLEEILENSHVEYVSMEQVKTAVQGLKEEADDSPENINVTEYESTDETKETSITDGFAENTDAVENSLDNEEITARSAESTNEIKETSITTDRSSLSFDPAIPVVPELNLDSLPDLTISSFNITDDEQKDTYQEESKDSSPLEIPLSSTKDDAHTDSAMFKEHSASERIEEKESSTEEKESHSTYTLECAQENQDTSKETVIEIAEIVEITKQKEVEIVETIEIKSSESDGANVVEMKTTTIDERHIVKADSEKQTRVSGDDALTIAATNNSNNSEVVNVNSTDVVARDDINESVCNETRENEQATKDVVENQSSLLTHRNDDVESSSRDFANTPSVIEQINVGAVDNDLHKSQLVNSSTSQCTTTRHLDSDDFSMKTDAAEAASPSNEGKDVNAIQSKDEPTTTEKQLNGDTTSAGVDAREDEQEGEEKADGDDAIDEKKEYHIYVPDLSISKDFSSTSESSTFMSAATKIQAGVRGFLTRRRLQSSQRRSSTLDSVPSIQESYAVESPAPSDTPAANNASSTKPVSPANSSSIPGAESTSSPLADGKARKKLRREDAVQRTTLSVENAFAENQLQHTGEFHDCIPLPVFSAKTLALKLARQVHEKHKPKSDSQETQISNASSSSSESSFVQRSKSDCFASGAGEREPAKTCSRPDAVEQLLGQMLLQGAAPNFAGSAMLAPFVDVVLVPTGDAADPMLQSKYLNFITSVEDVASELFVPGTPKGVIIEEITSLDENKSERNLSVSTDAVDSDSCKNASDGVEKEERPETELHTPAAITVADSTAAAVETHNSAEEKPPIVAAKAENPEVEEASSSLVEASESTGDEPLSMSNNDEVLALGEEDEKSRRSSRILAKLTAVDQLRSSSLSQDSPLLSDERTKSPVTMMQIAPTSVEERSDEEKTASLADDKAAAADVSEQSDKQ